MWRIWRLYDPLRAMAIQGVFLFGLAVLIHLVLLSTDHFNWFNQAAVKYGNKAPVAGAAQNSPMPAATPK
jgi:light-harvesting complex 1 alpha chain